MTSRAMAQILDKVSARAPHAASDGPRNFRAMPRPSALCAGGVALASLPQTSAAPLARGARVISGSLDGTTRGGGVLPCAQLSCEGCTLRTALPVPPISARCQGARLPGHCPGSALRNCHACPPTTTTRMRPLCETQGRARSSVPRTQ